MSSALFRLRTQAYRHLPLGAHRWLHWIKHAFFTSAGEKAAWDARVAAIQSSPDYPLIPRAPGAGETRGGYQIMHTGQRVLAGSYHGVAGETMLRACRGVHEPQEERAFGAVLPHLPAGSVMVEAGAYWAFYSLWLAVKVPGARCFCVEPDERNLAYGRANFAANAVAGTFEHGYVGAEPGRAPDGVPVVAVDEFLHRHGLDRIGLLHSDIQGFELDLLRGAAGALGRHAVDWLFVSTHGEALHQECEAFLQVRGYRIVVSINLPESYSVDGLLVAKAPGVLGPETMELSRRRATPAAG